VITFKARIRRGVLLPLNQSKVQDDLSKLPLDVEVDVKVEVAGKKRSHQQNQRHWGLIVPAFEQLGHERFSEWFELSGRSPKDSAHNVIKQMFLDPMRFDLPDGRYVDVWPSSADLTTEQFATMDEKAERYLNSLGTYLSAKESE